MKTFLIQLQSVLGCTNGNLSWVGSGTHHKVQTIADPKLLSCLTFGEVRQHIQKSNSPCGMRTKPSMFFSVLPVIKYSDQNNLREKGFCVAPSSRSWWEVKMVKG